MVEPFYTPESASAQPAIPLKEKAGWRGREVIPVASAEAANRLAREALAGGIDEVSFDLRRKNAVPSDALLAGLSGKNPVRLLLDGISLNNGLQPAAGGTAPVVAVDWLNRPAAPEGAHYDQLATLVRGGALPGKRPLVIGGGSIQDAGGAATQELAFTLAAFVDCA
ncbi:MAG: hypothetical protein ICV83_18575, partial [Cytophagales bacterium]|nr:hypothetical protein [Cytophagales bacterium]